MRNARRRDKNMGNTRGRQFAQRRSLDGTHAPLQHSLNALTTCFPIPLLAKLFANMLNALVGMPPPRHN